MEPATVAQPRPSAQFFNPAWFTSVMGTGVVSVALWQFGQEFGWLRPLGLLVYVLTLLMLLALLAVWLVKALRFPQAVVKDLHHPLLSQMLPTLPIALLVAAFASAQVGPALFGHLGGVHVLSLLVLYSVPQAWQAARQGRVAAHRVIMRRLYAGGLLLAGSLALLPGRMLHGWLFG